MVHGLLNIYKEKGYTSHDVVAKLRRIVGQKKIGHTGTLDPDAEGVLPVCLGKATKLCDMLTDKSKTYEAVMLLGVRTDTQDTTGTVIETGDVSGVTEAAVREEAAKFVGEYQQIPPMYSALKVGGKKLYELAREGKTVEREARTVYIYEIEIRKVELPRVTMKVHCSKGTYIRTLCDDIGEHLGCFGCMEKLTRTQVDRFLIKDSLTLAEVEKIRDEGKLNEILYRIPDMFPDYPRIYLKEASESAVRNGNSFEKCDVEYVSPEGNVPSDGEKVLVFSKVGDFIALYCYNGEEQHYRISKMFFDKIEPM